MIGQILAGAFLAYLNSKGASDSAYLGWAAEITAVTGILTTLVLMPGFIKDEKRRSFLRPENTKHKVFPKLSLILLLLVIGAGLSHLMNLAMVLLEPILPDGTYQEEMNAVADGKPLWYLILLIGICAPVAEEMVFRLMLFFRLRDHRALSFSAVVSAAVFGVYHGSVVQGIYAGVLGLAFALMLEYTGFLTASCLLHIGANIWSLVLSEYMVTLLYPSYFTYFSAFSVLLILTAAGGWIWLRGQYRKCQG